MKKVFAIAVVGLMVAFSSNAIASEIDSNDYDNIEFAIENAQVDAVAFEFVPVATEFAFNVADESVNSASVGEDFGSAVNTESVDTSNLSDFNIPIDDGYSTNIDESTLNEFTIDEPIPNLTEFTNSFTIYKPIPNLIESTLNVFTIDEPIPNLNEYFISSPNSNENVTKHIYNYTYGYEPPSIFDEIVTNVGKLTKYNI